MKLLRVTVAGLMEIVLVAAVGSAALRNPTIVWASALFTLLVMMLCSATLGAIAVRGPARLMWAGFAIFGSVYSKLPLELPLGPMTRLQLASFVVS